MSHFPRISCPICYKLETMPCDADKGLPPCDCTNGGHGPCKSAPCLSCTQKAIEQSRCKTTTFLHIPKRFTVLFLLLFLAAGCAQHRAPQIGPCNVTPCGDVCCNNDGKVCPWCKEPVR